MKKNHGMLVLIWLGLIYLSISIFIAREILTPWALFEGVLFMVRWGYIESFSLAVVMTVFIFIVVFGGLGWLGHLLIKKLQK